MPKESFPIIFIHRGDSFYLKYAFSNAHKFNPNARIILLGENVTQYPDFVEYYDINSFSKSLQKFRKIYKHYSYNNEEIERFCIERWLILNDFLKKEKIQKCLTLDSDVLLYVDAEKDSDKFAEYDFTLAHHSSGGLMYINNTNTIDKLSDYIFMLFSTEKGKEKLLSFWEPFRKKNDGGGVNDMLLLGWFYETMPKKIGEISDIIDDSTYDTMINGTQQSTVMNEGIKKIDFIDGLPYCTLKKSKKKVCMCCLHFQGPTKFYMKYFSAGHFSFIDKMNVHLMMFMREKISPFFNSDLRSFSKKMLSRLNF